MISAAPQHRSARPKVGSPPLPHTACLPTSIDHPTPVKSLHSTAMPLTNAGRLLFSRVKEGAETDNERDGVQPSSAASASSQPGIDVTSPASAGLAPRPKNHRRPTTLEDMVDDSFRCCVGLNCVSKFVGGDYDARRLRAEQEDFGRLASTTARSAWVTQKVPCMQLEPGKGSMEAAGQYVCNKFFTRAFSISNNLVENCKQTKRAPKNRSLL